MFIGAQVLGALIGGLVQVFAVGFYTILKVALFPALYASKLLMGLAIAGAGYAAYRLGKAAVELFRDQNNAQNRVTLALNQAQNRGGYHKKSYQASFALRERSMDAPMASGMAGAARVRVAKPAVPAIVVDANVARRMADRMSF